MFELGSSFNFNNDDPDKVSFEINELDQKIYPMFNDILTGVINL